ncbi:hypothetical protein EPN90_03405 [Patescibacteria group bacterium]|nr:MAG: hypothetical protein EPN90_03405 [Patescibacteria group bacterium]
MKKILSGIIFLSLFLIFFEASPTEAAVWYCVKAKDGKITSCGDQPTCPGLNLDNSQLENYGEIFKYDGTCAQIQGSPGCCFCLATANPGIASTLGCQNFCGNQKPMWFKESNCADAQAEQYKKSVAAEVPAAKPGAVAAPAAAPQKPIQLKNPLGTTSVPELIGRVVAALLGLSGSLALLMFVYGGFVWITSGGIPDRIAQGKNTMVWAALGLALIFGAYAILTYGLRILKG